MRPPSRAMSPEEQFETIRTRHKWELQVAGTPSKNDLEASNLNIYIMKFYNVAAILEVQVLRDGRYIPQ